MIHFTFFKRDEIKEAKKDKRKPVPSFGLTVENESSIKYYARKLDLFDDFLWFDCANNEI